MEESMLIYGERVNIGTKPAVITHCGFHDREEVRAAAIKNSEGEPLMPLEDVAAYFRKGVR